MKNMTNNNNLLAMTKKLRGRIIIKIKMIIMAMEIMKQKQIRTIKTNIDKKTIIYKPNISLLFAPFCEFYVL